MNKPWHSRTPSLPDELRYLQPFRRKFALLPPEELNEITAGDPLFALLTKRIKGLSGREAQEVLANDLEALQQWLADPAHENDCLQFVRGALMVSPARLATRILEQSATPAAPPPQAEMDLPKGAKVRRVKSRAGLGILIRWKGMLAALDAVSEEAAAGLEEAEGQDDGRSKLVSQPVRFGEASGTKLVRTGDSWCGPFKNVCYLLTVPGGRVHCSVAVVSRRLDGSQWDESPREAFFHTLRVIRRRPAG